MDAVSKEEESARQFLEDEPLLLIDALDSDAFDDIVKDNFSGAIDNIELQSRVISLLDEKGFTANNTLLATSLCCDELARRLEDDFVKVYGNNFNLGGLSGFPFAGNTGFGAMAAHIPDDGFCLIIYGPHVGISQDGTVGKVERDGIELVDTCCGSAVAALGYLKGITEGGAALNTDIRSFTDFQQNAVQKLILPYGQRLERSTNTMVELPYALYETQDLLMAQILEAGFKGTKKGVALLGGVQINTGPETVDYFHPMRFDYMTQELQDKGMKEDLLPALLGLKVNNGGVDEDIPATGGESTMVSEPDGETKDIGLPKDSTEQEIASEAQVDLTEDDQVKDMQMDLSGVTTEDETLVSPQTKNEAEDDDKNEEDLSDQPTPKKINKETEPIIGGEFPGSSSDDESRVAQDIPWWDNPRSSIKTNGGNFDSWWDEGSESSWKGL